MFRRKRLPDALEPAYEAFEAVLEQIEPAKAGLADVLPGTRMPGRPLHDALAAYETGLTAAVPLMPAWRCPEVEEEWESCERALAAGLRRAATLRDVASEPEGFEALLGAVSSLIDALEPFADAEERFRGLRR